MADTKKLEHLCKKTENDVTFAIPLIILQWIWSLWETFLLKIGPLQRSKKHLWNYYQN